MRIKISDKKHSLVRKKKACKKSLSTQNYLIKIDTNNGKRYEALVRPRIDRGYNVYNVHEISTKRKSGIKKIEASIVDRGKRWYNDSSMRKKMHRRKNLPIEDILIGQSVIIHESTLLRTKTLIGKIISVSPKIIGTPAGEGGLPPVDE